MLDVLIRNGTLVDGTGAPGQIADLAIKDGRIVRIAPEIALEAALTIDASGLIVAPGFVDSHSHCDPYAMFGSDGYNMLEQGVTTEIAGNCGDSAALTLPEKFASLKGFLPPDFVDARAKAMQTVEGFCEAAQGGVYGTNWTSYLGNGTLREAVMGMRNEAANAMELNRMLALLKVAMEHGFAGLSSGLIYPPSAYADQAELTRLCRVVAEYGGTYATHIRGESDTVVQAVQEALAIGEDSGCDVVISHHKICGRQNQGKSAQTLRLIAEANARGRISVRLDQYPFLAGQSALLSALPAHLASEGTDTLMKRLRECDFRTAVTRELERPETVSLVKESGFSGAVILQSPGHPELSGCSLSDVAAARGVSPYDAMYDLLLDGGDDIKMAYFHVSEPDMDAILQDPNAMVGADSGHNIQHFDTETPGGAHPRAMSTFPKYLRLVRERAPFPMEEAIRRITDAPARAAHLHDAGTLLENRRADVTVFDWTSIGETNSFAYPYRKNNGISYVFVNGVLAVKDGAYNGARAGKWLTVR